MKNFIDYLDEKISKISKMNDDEAEAICPYVEVNSKNIRDFADNEKKKWEDYDENFKELCSRLGKKV